MRTIAFLFLVLFSHTGTAQIEASKTSHDFGNLYANMPTYVDFTFKNTGQSKVFLLSVNKPREVYYLYSSKTVQPDSSVTVRLKINDNIKGRFNYKTEVFFSNSNNPFVITLTGNVKERNSNPLMACPDFNADPPPNGLAEFEVTVKVVDSITQEPIRRSKVFFVSNGEMVAVHYTNGDGIIHETIPLGLYYITAQKDGYNSNYFDGYLNFKTNYVEIKLQQPVKALPDEIVANEPDPIAIEEPEIVFEEEPIEIVVNEEPDVIIIDENEPTEVVEVPETTIDSSLVLPALIDTGFSSNKYAPNNLVFIVDVSSSMNQMGKIELLKLSMIELTKLLRPQDQVSVLAYAGTVNVLFELKKGTDKEEIIEKIKTLKTGGYTAGDEAIKAGIKIAKKGYIDGGNNLVFMVTDGAFNKGSKSYMRTIQMAHETKNIKFSVVGIKTGEYLGSHLTSVAEKGGGTYVRIITIDDAQNKLFEEVKRTSLIKD
ncbi:MAG: VWA domain-containing protein [Putridiphycobacter sp.]|nr:VWA domain-containing protein [Putridiphycobacter sp.]